MQTFPHPEAIANKLIKLPARKLHTERIVAPPSLAVDSGEQAWHRYVEFFTARIRNRNTRGVRPSRDAVLHLV